MWLLSFLLCSFLLMGGEFRLKERIEKAKSGDYVVTEANKMVTLLAIRSISPTTLLLEEISAPLQNLKKRPASWPEWVKAKAPGHTSWSMIEIDLQTSQILECYSFSRATWVHLSQNESLFATLLDVPLLSIDPTRQRKIGPPPMEGEPDLRKTWTPSLVFEGQKIEGARFEVFETTWPKDGSEMSGQAVCLYFDQDKRFPFPYWVQVETSHATAALCTIDSGKNLPAVHRTLPRRIPEFIGNPQKTQSGLRLSLKCPKYYRQFELFAIDVTHKEKQICPITHSLVQGDEEFLTLEIDQEELKQNLQSDHRYTWLLVPTGYSESYTESHKPFIYLPQ